MHKSYLLERHGKELKRLWKELHQLMKARKKNPELGEKMWALKLKILRFYFPKT